MSMTQNKVDMTVTLTDFFSKLTPNEAMSVCMTYKEDGVELPYIAINIEGGHMNGRCSIVTFGHCGEMISPALIPFVELKTLRILFEDNGKPKNAQTIAEKAVDHVYRVINKNVKLLKGLQRNNSVQPLSQFVASLDKDSLSRHR